MSKKIKSPPSLPEKAVQPQAVKLAQMAISPELNSALVVDTFQKNILGEDELTMQALMDGLHGTFMDSKNGNLAGLEAMLIGQATALQTIFTSLARRAQSQEYIKQYGVYMTLALKAQAQSRATVQAVIDLKFPRQVSFVKQANISHGAQQVNNGSPTANEPNQSHAEEKTIQQNELLEDQCHGRTNLDAGSTETAVRGNQTVEAMGTVNRAKKRVRQG